MLSIQRRLKALEVVMGDALTPEYPDLTRSEVAAIAQRFHSGEKLTRTELNRLERQSPIIDGELLLTCYRGHVTAKRYLGIDLDEL